MSLTIQTNVSSLVAQENLRVTSEFQAKTIQRLTSGYRINRSGDDAAGLAVANKFRSDIAELTQGVRNANDGAGQLQIIDGGLANVGRMLDRLKTLATQSGSDTFTGNRATLNNEYRALLSEIDRQASNIGLNANGNFNKVLTVYMGGGSSAANAQVGVDLAGALNRVDSTGLLINATSIDAGGTALTGNTVNNLNSSSTLILSGHSTGGTQTFAINYIDSNGAQQALNATVTSTDATGITVSAAVTQLNTRLVDLGLTAAVDSSGSLIVGGTRAFALTGAAVTANAGGSGSIVTTSGLASVASTAINQATYNVSSTFAAPQATTPEIISFSNGEVTKFVTISSVNSTNATTLVNTINAQTASLGIHAIRTDGTTGFAIQSSSSFTMTMVQHDDDGAGVASGPFTAGFAVGQSITVDGPDASASSVGNSLAAITAINNAVLRLGNVQGTVGAAENQLMYAINLAQSQIANFSSSEAQIRDADVASEAANLTKAQVLSQASIAAMAQANAAPQGILSLLRG